MAIVHPTACQRLLALRAISSTLRVNVIYEVVVGYPQRSGPPSWFIFLIGIAVVFGVYYLWLGLRNFMATGATVIESTRQAIVEYTATAERIVELEILAPTALPTFTPVPSCEDFVVTVQTAIIRSQPSTNSRIVGAVDEGETVCVIAREANSEWYVLDDNPLTRRLEPVFMHEDIIRALHPTPTPTRTFTPSPTTSPSPTFTKSPTPTPLPSRRPSTQEAPSITPRPTITPTRASVRL